jgi:hypothetical protein
MGEALYRDVGRLPHHASPARFCSQAPSPVDRFHDGNHIRGNMFSKIPQRPELAPSRILSSCSPPTQLSGYGVSGLML